MSDREYMRKFLNEVLGPERNRTLEEISKDIKIDWKSKWREEGCCKNFLVGFCPYLQFQNTKSDIGSCKSRSHDELVRDKFLSLASKEEKDEYEELFYKLLSKLISDFERRLRRSKDRVREEHGSLTSIPTSMDGSGLVNAPTNDAAFDILEEKRTLLDYQLRESLKRIESLGEEGLISEAQSVMLESDQYKIQLDQIRHQQIAIVKVGMTKSPTDQPIDDRNIEKKMEICSTCGAFLIIGDSQKRIESHFEGKQHNGWARIRQTFEELEKKYTMRSRRSSSNIRSLPESSSYSSYSIPTSPSYSTKRRSPPSEDGEIIEDGELVNNNNWHGHRNHQNNDRYSEPSSPRYSNF